MDLRTGKTYDSPEAARADGVPQSDIAYVRDGLSKIEQRLRAGKPVVTFDRGSFKSKIRNEQGELVTVGAGKA